MPLIGLSKVQKAVDNLVAEQNEKVKAVYIQGLSAVIYHDSSAFPGRW